MKSLRRRKSKMIALVLVVLALAAVASTAGWSYYNYYQPYRPVVVIPPVVTAPKHVDTVNVDVDVANKSWINTGGSNYWATGYAGNCGLCNGFGSLLDLDVTQVADIDIGVGIHGTGLINVP